MSIIYDALKKTEQKITPTEPPKEVKKEKNTLLTIGIVVIFLGFIGSGIAVAILFSALKTPATQTALKKKADKTNIIKSALSLLSKRLIVKTTSAQAPRTQRNNSPGGWDLQGIMDMNGEKVALINEQILKEGDEVDGARVMRVADNNVELSHQDKIIVLKLK